MNNSRSEKPADEFLLTFADLLLLIKKNMKKIRLSALAFALLALFYGLSKPIEYEAEASFKDKGKSQSGMGSSLSAAFFMMSDGSDNNALTFMRSRMLIEELMKEQNLQGIVVQNEYRFPFIPFGTIKNNLLVEYALYKKMAHPILNEIKKDLSIHTIAYNGEVPKYFQVNVLSKDKFSLNNNGQETEGDFNQPFAGEDYSFTLESNDGFEENDKYTLVLLPLEKTAEMLSKQFKIEPDRLDKSLLKISYSNPDRRVATDSVNSLMSIYQKHVEKEHAKICEKQICYLTQRQTEMGKVLEKMMKAHADELSSDLSSTGFATSEKAMDFLAHTQHELKRQLLTIKLEIQRLQMAKSDVHLDNDVFTSINNLEVVNKLATEKRQLKQQADSLNLVLKNIPKNQRPSSTEFQGINLNVARELYLSYNKELSDTESLATQHEFIATQLNEPEFEISSIGSSLSDPLSLSMITKASDLILALKDQDNRSSKEQERLNADLSIQKGFLKTHIKQSISLLSLRQNFLKGKIQQLQSLNLSLIQEQISILENQINEYITSTLQKLGQEKHLIEKNLSELNMEMAAFPQKWAAEQLIDQQMEINKKLVEEISKLVESKNISNNLEKLQSAPVDIAYPPIHPKSPRLALLTIFGALVGAFLGFLWILGWSVLQGVQVSADNLRAAGQYVCGTLSRNYHDSFKEDPLLDSDLETLRRLIGYIDPKKNALGNPNTLLLLEGNGPNYASSLAQLLSFKGLKTLILEMRFEHPESEKGTENIQGRSRGMLQYLEGKIEEPEIVHHSGYDKVVSGGMCRYANELISSQRFVDLLSGLTKKYDCVLVNSSAMPKSAETENLLEIFPYAAISISDEILQDLKGCIKHKGDLKRKIAFIMT